MNIREYHAKRIFSKYNINTPKGRLVTSVQDAILAATSIGFPVMLKPQLWHSKKRGQAGAILEAQSIREVKQAATKLLKSTLNDEQVSAILVEQKIDIKAELFLGVTIDPEARHPVLIASKRGGVDIEDLVEKSPQHITRYPLSPGKSLSKLQLSKIATHFPSDFIKISKNLIKLFYKLDADLVEINPLVQTNDNDFIAVDAALSIDDNALYRQQDLLSLDNESPINAAETEAKKYRWTFVPLDGDISIVSSGAGLTMSMLDLIKRFRGRAKNFLDTAQMDKEGIKQAIKFIAKNSPGKVLVIQVLAGLNNCRDLAEGIKDYLQTSKSSMPIVVRMAGRNQIAGHKILSRVGVPVYSELEDAVHQAVSISKR